MTGWAVLAGALFLFALSAVRGYSTKTAVRDFFHIDGLRRNVLSLGIADVTLGTGFAYVLSASSQYGLLMLALPVGLVVGYRLLASLYRGLDEGRAVASGNLFLAVRDRSVGEGAIASRWVFDGCVTLPLILVYLLFVCYEVFASSQIIAGFIAPSGGTAAAAVIGAAIVAVSGLNSVAGGMQANWRNDRLLAVGISLLLLIVVATSLAGPPAAVAGRPPDRLAVLTVVVLGFLNAVATQIYSLLNAYNGANFATGREAARSYRRVGLVVAGFIGILVLVGSARPLDLAQGLPAALGARLDALALPGPARAIFSAATVFGMVAVVFSTIDTLMLALAYFIRRHLLNRSTDAGPATGSGSSRLLVAVLYFGVMPPLALLYLADPDLFTLLLTLGGGGAIFAPMILASALAMRRASGPRLTTGWLAGFAGLFIVSGIVGAVLMRHDPAALPVASLAMLVMAMLLAMGWYRLAPRPALAAAS